MSSTYRSVLVLKPVPFKITHHDRIVTLGSCFSENIGKRFQQNKFNITINPFGQQYNPASMVNGIQRLLDKKWVNADELFLHNELYHSWQHHSDFSKPTIEAALTAMNSGMQAASNQLEQCDYLFLTFGTAHVFSLKPEAITPAATEEYIVSNCHKISGAHFNKRYLSPDEIVDLLTSAIHAIRTVNPKVKVVLTVSPVRYLAFGFEENTLSKAHLFTAIHQLVQALPDVYYFPAYELVMDDLRDYRFFTEDYLHPNRMATEYVWQALIQNMLAKESIATVDKIAAIQAAASHKPRNPESLAHQQFIQKTLATINQLKQTTALDFKEEETLLLRNLNPS